jgi:hypothetical protein
MRDERERDESVILASLSLNPCSARERHASLGRERPGSGYGSKNGLVFRDATVVFEALKERERFVIGPGDVPPQLNEQLSLLHELNTRQQDLGFP